MTGRAALTAAVCLALPTALTAQDTPIQDNSFLIEEAYNQERGIVQHIAAWSRTRGGDWQLDLTQEWPLGGIRHQGSYTIPLVRGDGGTGIGDVGFNYRYQLGGERSRTHAAPRLSVLLPTGRASRGRGTGGLGFELELPVSHQLTERVVMHFNAGVTLTPSAHDLLDRSATTTDFNVGGSTIWLLRPTFNLMLEALWERTEAVVGEGAVIAEELFVLNPGARYAFNFASGLQIVPGAAYTIAVAPASAEDAVFLYLSFEHPF